MSQFQHLLVAFRIALAEIYAESQHPALEGTKIVMDSTEIEHLGNAVYGVCTARVRETEAIDALAAHVV